MEAMRFGLVVCDVLLVPSSVAALQLLDCTIFADQAVLQAATLLLVASAVANTMTMSIGPEHPALAPCARTHRVFAVMTARFLHTSTWWLP